MYVEGPTKQCKRTQGQIDKFTIDDYVDQKNMIVLLDWKLKAGVSYVFQILIKFRSMFLQKKNEKRKKRETSVSPSNFRNHFKSLHCAAPQGAGLSLESRVRM